jgi:hypothetical protein
MPIRIALWRVGSKPESLAESSLAQEQLLENMIVVAPRILDDEWMLIGRQEETGFGGRIDLLAIAPDASLVLIELKRNRTPREVVAQSIDYASWVERLRPDEIAAIYERFAPGRSLAQDFRQRFGEDLDEETLNQSHQIIIVAGALDDSTERIVAYLSERDIPINVLCFQVFNDETGQLLSRAWLVDPVRTQVSASAGMSGSKEPWNGEFYANFGYAGKTRSWDEAVRYGFLCAGGGSFYSKTLQLLRQDDRVWVNAPGYGYVGVGRVTGPVQPAGDFKIDTATGEVSAIEVLTGGTYHREFLSDPERCEYFVPVRWLQTAPLDKAVKEIGLFGNRDTVCKPTSPKWRYTVERLKKEFPEFDKS